MLIPADVKEWVRDKFLSCNSRISAKLTNIPNGPEETFDLTWIEYFSQFASPIALQSGWTIRVETHYLGGLRHFNRWEIADIGLLIFFRSGGRLLRSKVALLQSKRLYPSNNLVTEGHWLDYQTGLARLADPEILGAANPPPTTFEFSTESHYRALARGSEQVNAIDRYTEENRLQVYYQLYNPWSLPLERTVPLEAAVLPVGKPPVGIRIQRSTDVHSVLNECEAATPSVADLGTRGHWRLEDFVADELLDCREGDLLESLNEPRVTNLFYRRSGPISAAISMVLDSPD